MAATLRSMTGYGEGMDSSYGKLTFMLSSINHKSLHIDCKLPPLLAKFEEKIRRTIQAKIERGRITATLIWSERPAESATFHLNAPLIEKLKPHLKSLPAEMWSGACMSLGLIEKSETLADQAALEKILCTALEIALEELIASKKREGSELQNALEGHLQALHQQIQSIDSAKEQALLYAEKKAKFEQLALNNERIESEIALLVDKADVTEEIDRIKAHLTEVQNILSKPWISKGKMLDFLLQELAREAGTLTCKVAQMDSKRAGIEMRSTIEKMREQVANVE